MQGGAAHHLHVEVPLPEGAAGRLAGDGERLDEQVVDGLAVGQAGAELVGLGAQLGVGEGDHVVLERVDGVGDGPQAPEDLALTGAQELGQDHGVHSLDSGASPRAGEQPLHSRRA